MTDFETLVRESLTAAGARAAGASGLVRGARDRARRRRRRTALASVATVAAMVGVSTAVVLSRPSSDREPDRPVATDAGATAGWRVETWRDLTVLVPPEWGYGAPDQWCADGSDGSGPDAVGGIGVVQRPEGGQTEVGCSPQVGYGLRFVDPESGPDEFPRSDSEHIFESDQSGDPIFPPGWFFYYRPEGAQAAIEVVAPDRATAEQIRDSAQRVTQDANGCWSRVGRDPDRSEDLPADRLSVCRYGADGWLQQTERLSVADTAKALSAVAAAPVRKLNFRECPRSATHPSSVVLLTRGQDLGSITVLYDSGCAATDGLVLSGVIRELTPEVLYWALSPGWSGGWDPDVVPMPEKFRRLPGA